MFKIGLSLLASAIWIFEGLIWLGANSAQAVEQLKPLQELEKFALANPDLAHMLALDYALPAMVALLCLAAGALSVEAAYLLVHAAIGIVGAPFFAVYWIIERAYGYYLNRKAKIITSEVDKGNKVF
jgi:hypothetical protein